MSQRKRSPSNPRKTTYIETLEARIAPAALTVSNLHDSGPGSLRQAILDANGAAGADNIDFHHGLQGTIKLATDLPAITDAVTISGPGASKLIVNGHLHQLISVTGPHVDATISGVTLTGGQAANGGGVNVDDMGGAVTFSKTTISGNRAVQTGDGLYRGQGGGIAVVEGTVKLQNSKVSGNKAATLLSTTTYSPKGGSKTTTKLVIDGVGGGLYVSISGTVDVQTSVISGNFAADGGGIHNFGTLTVEQGSKISNNTVKSVFYSNPAVGGGISNAAGGIVTVSDSKITGNRAIGVKGSGGAYSQHGSDAQGGGIFNEANGTVSVANSIISGNHVIGGKGSKGTSGAAGYQSYVGRGSKGGVGGTGGAGGAAKGAGIFNAGTFTVQTSKITGNSALGGAGGIGGTGGKGGQGAPSAPAYIYNGHVVSPVKPPGPGGFGGLGGPGGAGGLAKGGGVYDSTRTIDLTTSTVTGNKEVNGKNGTKGATGPMGPRGSSGGGNPYGGNPYT